MVKFPGGNSLNLMCTAKLKTWPHQNSVLGTNAIFYKDGFYRLTKKTSERKVWVRSWCSLGHIGSPKVTRLLMTSIHTFLGRKPVIAYCFKVNRSP